MAGKDTAGITAVALGLGVIAAAVLAASRDGGNTETGESFSVAGVFALGIVDAELKVVDDAIDAAVSDEDDDDEDAADAAIVDFVVLVPSGPHESLIGCS